MGNLREGMYDARPLKVSLTTSEVKKTEMMAFAVVVKDDDGGTHELIKNGGLTDESLAYTVQDAQNMGCDTSDPMMCNWKADPNRKLRVRIAMDPKYGPQVKSIFDADKGVPAEAILKKTAMPEARQKEISAQLADRIKAINATNAAKLSGDGSGGGHNNSGDVPF